MKKIFALILLAISFTIIFSACSTENEKTLDVSPSNCPEKTPEITCSPTWPTPSYRDYEPNVVLVTLKEACQEDFLALFPQIDIVSAEALYDSSTAYKVTIDPDFGLTKALDEFRASQLVADATLNYTMYPA